MPLYKSLIFFILLVVSSSSILTFRYSFYLFLKCLLTLSLILLRLSTLHWLGACSHCIWTFFLWSKNRKNSSSNRGLCFFKLHRFRLWSTEIFLYSLIFSQALFMFYLSFKSSKAANMFYILIWYCFLTSSTLSFLRLNLPHRNSGLRVYLLPIFP